jgi:predicted phosphodiesterase
MRIALISDLHASEVSLDATLRDIRRQGVDQIVCLGDVATLGPRPKEIIARLRDLGCPCILGNHDEFLFNPAILSTYTEVPIIVQAVDWCREQLSSDELDFLRSFRATLSIDLDGQPGNRLFLYHGSPRSHMEELLSTTPADQVDRMLEGNIATVMAGGHTHFQMMRQHNGILLVNPGSVGLPFKDFVPGNAPTVMCHAEYAIVESHAAGVAVHLHRVALDKRELYAAAQDCTNPFRQMLMHHYR